MAFHFEIIIVSKTIFRSDRNALMNRTECGCPRVCHLTVYDSFVEETMDINEIESDAVDGKLLIYYSEKRFLVSTDTLIHTKTNRNL